MCYMYKHYINTYWTFVLVMEMIDIVLSPSANTFKLKELI